MDSESVARPSQACGCQVVCAMHAEAPAAHRFLVAQVTEAQALVGRMERGAAGATIDESRRQWRRGLGLIIVGLGLVLLGARLVPTTAALAALGLAALLGGLGLMTGGVYGLLRRGRG